MALPEVCLLTADGAARSPRSCWPAWRSTGSAMRRNLDGYTGSEQRPGRCSRPRLGKHAARAALQTALSTAVPPDGRWATRCSEAGLLRPRRPSPLAPDTGAAGEMVDLVVAEPRRPGRGGRRGRDRDGRQLAVLPTPLVEAPRLADALGLSRSLLVKRDDLTGFAVAGNKARQLELLIAERGCRRMPTSWSPAARSARTSCRPRPPRRRTPGWGACVVLAGDARRPRRPPQPRRRDARGAPSCAGRGKRDRTSVDAMLPRVAAQLAGEGARPYLVPRGGANATGALGYRLAVDEVAQPARRPRPRRWSSPSVPAARSPGWWRASSLTADRSESSVRA